MTTSPSSDVMLAKVRALLAKAENAAATPAEAEAYTAKAAELLAKYGIDRAMLAASDPTTDIVGDIRIDCMPPFAREKVSLLDWIAKPLRVQAIMDSRKQRNGVIRVHLFGFESDLERVNVLYTSLLIQAQTGVLAAPVPWHVYTPQAIGAYRRSWLAGFAQAVSRRLRQAEARAAEAQPASSEGMSTALVLVDRKAQVDRAVASVYSKLTTSYRSLSGGGREAGYSAGQRADLGGARISQSASRGALAR